MNATKPITAKTAAILAAFLDDAARAAQIAKTNPNYEAEARRLADVCDKLMKAVLGLA